MLSHKYCALKGLKVLWYGSPMQVHLDMGWQQKKITHPIGPALHNPPQPRHNLPQSLPLQLHLMSTCILCYCTCIYLNTRGTYYTLLMNNNWSANNEWANRWLQAIHKIQQTILSMRICSYNFCPKSYYAWPMYAYVCHWRSAEEVRITIFCARLQLSVHPVHTQSSAIHSSVQWSAVLQSVPYSGHEQYFPSLFPHPDIINEAQPCVVSALPLCLYHTVHLPYIHVHKTQHAHVMHIVKRMWGTSVCCIMCLPADTFIFHQP